MIETDAAGFGIQVDDLDADWLLSLVEDAETQSRAAERRKLRYAAQWCRLHPAEEHDERDEPVGGDGTPLVAEFAAEPFGAALQVSTHAARQLMADALDLQCRLPLIWARVEALEVPGWRARRIAQATSHLTREQAAIVDRALVARAGSCGGVLIDRAIATASADADPTEQESEEARARQSWDVRLFHGPAAGPGRWAGTSILEITGDTLSLTRLHDLICATAAGLGRAGDPDSRRSAGPRPSASSPTGCTAADRCAPGSSCTPTSPTSRTARPAPDPSNVSARPPWQGSGSGSATPG